MKSFIAVIALALAVVAVNGSAYAPAPAGPPCPKSVVVSCAPVVQKVPCKPSGHAPGKPAAHKGAYSEQYPQYVAPVVLEEPTEDMAASASEYAPQYYAPNSSPYYKYY